MLKRHFAVVLLAIAALVPFGCDDTPESGRAIVSVSDINGGVPVELSVSSGTSDMVVMEFRWRPYNNESPVVSEATPHGDIIIEHYRITWTRVSAGSGALPAREEDTSIFVPVFDLVNGAIRLVTADEKTDPSLAGAPVTMTAHIDFNAREMGTAHEIVEFSTNFTVVFNP
jgi:hypothetical protein